MSLRPYVVDRVSKYNRPAQVRAVLLSGMNLYLVANKKSFIATLGYDLDRNVYNSLIFTEIARQPNSLIFLPV